MKLGILPTQTHTKKDEKLRGRGTQRQREWELGPCSLALIRDHYGDGGLDFDSYMERKRRCMIPKPKTNIDHLCDSLMVEIFLRLPIKSAKRCSAVSKRWYALMSDPDFIRCFEQGLKNKNKDFAFVFHYDGFMAVKNIVVGSNEPDFKSRGFSLTYLPCCRRRPHVVELPSVVASCNDLLLCSEKLCRQEIYYVCNPFTQDWVQLPPAPPPHAAAAVGLICDTGQWKVNVVSLAPRTFGRYLFRRYGIPFNGLLFWHIPGEGLVGLDPYDGGQFRYFINVPAKFHDSTINGGFGVCMGRLRLFQISKDPLLNIPFICFWDLKNLEESEWVLEKLVYFRDMVGVSKEREFTWLTNAPTEHLPQVLGCVPDDGDVVHIVALNGHENVRKVVSCNISKGTLEEVCDVPSKHECLLNEVYTCKLPWRPTPIPTIPFQAGNPSFTTWPLIKEGVDIVYS